MTHPTSRLIPFSWLLLLLVYLLIQLSTITFFEPAYDEGVYLAEAHLLTAGHRLYREVHSASPPLFIWGVAAIFRAAGGVHIIAVRAAIILWGLLGLGALGRIAQRLAPPSSAPVAALYAAFLLLTLPLWRYVARIGMADVPSLSLSLLAIALALEGWRAGRRWYALGGLAAGLALGVKLLAAYTAPVLALIVCLGYRAERPFTVRRFLLDGLATLGGYLLPLLLMLPFLDLAATYDSMVRFPWEAGRDWPMPLNPWQMMLLYHVQHPAQGLLALLGGAWLYLRQQRHALLFLLGWEALVAIMLSQHAPLWNHVLLPLLLPTILLAALGLGDFLTARRLPTGWQLAPLLLGLLLLGLSGLVGTGDAERVVAASPYFPALQEEVVPYLQARVPPEERILSDEPMIPLLANRLMPTGLTDTSFTKIYSGFLSAEGLIAASEAQPPAAIVFWSDRFTILPEWEAWVERHYVLAREISPTHRIYLRPDLLP